MAAEVVPRFCILGSSVSGLASAFFLQRSFPLARISIMEVQCSRFQGGLVRSVHESSSGRITEQGFHSSILVNKNGREALGLARLLGLEEEVVSANIEASARRHLYHNGKVQLFPRLPHMLLYGPAMFAEPVWPRGRSDDESVHTFVARRASTGVADRIADPLCLGQLAGDARYLSARTCFPRLWFNERHFRSVFVGAMLSTVAAHRRRSWLSLDLLDPLLQRISTGGRCYSFKGGLGMLPERLSERLQNPAAGTRPAEILSGAEAVAIKEPTQTLEGGLQPPEVLLSDGRSIAADAVIAAVPPADLLHLIDRSGLDIPCNGPWGGSVCALLKSIKHETVGVVSARFEGAALRSKFRGAGYFCGSLEQQQILGMTWDSQLFPERSPAGATPETRLTVYVGGPHCGDALSSEAAAEAAALRAVREHLGIDDAPAEVSTTLWRESVPQYAVGHHHAIRELNKVRLAKMPWLQVVGAGYFGVRAVADEVVDARELADALSRRFLRFPALVENETAQDSACRYSGGFDTG
eukprot:gnl/TRDRNA2_/TRDRNA2_121834_c0_seq1.p1 gnl/TRDRNA2_/TRDRNA2_121834_c0~~gnl/TRDRNA2_/TRDRNA2_121834_c0_seq1.p1  ORF type:complete len:558 (+),score=71.18 gnl/TRDRNA2_/TRDRNA2_121834_c0_seq1:97-1674(+)